MYTSVGPTDNVVIIPYIMRRMHTITIRTTYNVLTRRSRASGHLS